MGTLYVRVGNRTMPYEQAKVLSSKQVKEIEESAKKANEKRLENMRRGLGLEPQKVTLDVTPKAVAARKAAIAAEEAKIAAEAEAGSSEQTQTQPVDEKPKASEGKGKKKVA